MTAEPSVPACPDPPRQGDDELGLEGVGFLLGIAHRAHRRRWDASLADLDLTAPQAAVLRLVTSEPGCGVRDVARRLGTDPMNAWRIIETLVASGLCAAGHDPDDARRRPFHPTQRGRHLARQVAERALQTEQESVEVLGGRTYRVLLDALRTLAEHDAQALPTRPGTRVGEGRSGADSTAS